jgi:hypothetical protein
VEHLNTLLFLWRPPPPTPSSSTQYLLTCSTIIKTQHRRGLFNLLYPFCKSITITTESANMRVLCVRSHSHMRRAQPLRFYDWILMHILFPPIRASVTRQSHPSPFASPNNSDKGHIANLLHTQFSLLLCYSIFLGGSCPKYSVYVWCNSSVLNSFFLWQHDL